MLAAVRSAFRSSFRSARTRNTVVYTPAFTKISYRAMSDVKTATIEASELPAGTMKMVEVGEGQVLVSNVKGEIVSCLEWN